MGGSRTITYKGGVSPCVTPTPALTRRSVECVSELTEREQWLKENFGFLKTVIRYIAEPVHRVSIHTY